MAYVAATAALFAAGAYLGRNLLIYSVIGLVIFAGFTMFDFQRLRRSSDIASAPWAPELPSGRCFVKVAGGPSPAQVTATP